MKSSHRVLERARIPLLVIVIALLIHVAGVSVLRHKVAAISAIAEGAGLALILHLGVLVPLVSLLRHRAGR